MRERFEKQTTDLRLRDESYVSQFLNPDLLGVQIGEGLRMRIYQLRDDFNISKTKVPLYDPWFYTTGAIGEVIPETKFVIKIPRTESIIAPSRASRKIAHLETAITYFDRLVTYPTFVLTDENQHDYCLIQKHLGDSMGLTPENVLLVDSEFQTFLMLHRKFVADGMCLELLGLEGLLKIISSKINKKRVAEISNLAVFQESGNYHLTIPDVTVMYFGKQFYPRDPIRRKRSEFGYKINRKMIADQISADIGKYS